MREFSRCHSVREAHVERVQVEVQQSRGHGVEARALHVGVAEVREQGVLQTAV